MEDRDIIKAYACCNLSRLDIDGCRGCEDCPLQNKNGYCLVTEEKYNLEQEVFELLNRKNSEVEVKNKLLDIAEEKFETIKADTIQEFIKRFEKKIKDVEFTIGQAWEIKSAIKEVVKEMVGE